MTKENMKVVLFGYNRKTVDIFLNKLHRMQEEQIEELSARLQKAAVERERLLAELARLEKKQSAVLTHEQMALVRQRVQETKRWLETGQGSSDIESTLPEAKSLSKAIDFYDAAAKRARKLAAGKEQPPQQAGLPGEAGQHAAAAGEQQANLELAEAVAKTNAVAANAASRPVIEQYRWVPNARPKHAAVGNSFWDDADEFLDPIGGELLLPAYEQLAAATEAPPDSYFVQGESVERNAPAAANRTMMNPDIAYPDPESNRKQASAELQAVTQPSLAASEPGVAPAKPVDPAGGPAAAPPRSSSPELDALKRNYIVGKLAGDDLLGRRGQLIIARHAEITEETVRLAEQEGKLAELIVNMIIQGLED
ncbi:hypothetical protein ACFFK0_22590 [Paenibacillus chartarius]|uniref:Uncharacterized protein n=1 Tax=Paenibacillus chartarius TaxID=747481 RepID=A0ABV6DRB6_9BACL